MKKKYKLSWLVIFLGLCIAIGLLIFSIQLEIYPPREKYTFGIELSDNQYSNSVVWNYIVRCNYEKNPTECNMSFFFKTENLSIMQIYYPESLELININNLTTEAYSISNANKSNYVHHKNTTVREVNFSKKYIKGYIIAAFKGKITPNAVFINFVNTREAPSPNADSKVFMELYLGKKYDCEYCIGPTRKCDVYREGETIIARVPLIDNENFRYEAIRHADFSTNVYYADKKICKDFLFALSISLISGLIVGLITMLFS